MAGLTSIRTNAWLGVSVEDRKYGLPRIDELRQVDAQIRFLSVEPLLEGLGEMNLEGIHWVIVGGESGPKARPMRPEWVQEIKAQCEANDVAFFFKQWGDGEPMERNEPRKRTGGILTVEPGIKCP